MAQVLDTVNVSIPPQGIRAVIYNLLTEAETQDAVTVDTLATVRQLIGDYDVLTAFVYIEEIAQQWGGWIARVEYENGKEPQVFFDNDPTTREAAFRDLE
ncbi:MAG: hypothetical protein ACYS1A_18020 [Planctomycetota bacterium]|jgi:hypothetical protein